MKAVGRNEVKSRVERSKLFVNALTRELENRGHTVEVAREFNGAFQLGRVDDRGPGLYITRRGTRYNDRGPLQYTIDNSRFPGGKKKVFPEPTNGFDVEKAADRVEEYLVLSKEDEEYRKYLSDSKVERERKFGDLLRKCGIERCSYLHSEGEAEFGGTSVRFKSYSETGIGVEFRVSPDEFEKVVKALAAALGEKE